MGAKCAPSAVEKLSASSTASDAEKIRLEERPSEFEFFYTSLSGSKDPNPGKLIIEYETVVEMTRQLLSLLNGTDIAVRAEVRKSLSASEALKRSMQRNLHSLMGKRIMDTLQRLLQAGLSGELNGLRRTTWC